MLRLALLTLAAVAFLLPACGGDEMVGAEGALGGYKIAETDDPGVLEAAEFAVTAQSQASGSTITLHHVLKAYEQVVAGLNYRLILQVRDGSASRLADVVVYRDPEAQFSLTSWDWE